MKMGKISKCLSYGLLSTLLILQPTGAYAQPFELESEREQAVIDYKKVQLDATGSPARNGHDWFMAGPLSTVSEPDPIVKKKVQLEVQKKEIQEKELAQSFITPDVPEDDDYSVDFSRSQQSGLKVGIGEPLFNIDGNEFFEELNGVYHREPNRAVRYGNGSFQSNVDVLDDGNYWIEVSIDLAAHSTNWEAMIGETVSLYLYQGTEDIKNSSYRGPIRFTIGQDGTATAMIESKLMQGNSTLLFKWFGDKYEEVDGEVKIDLNLAITEVSVWHESDKPQQPLSLPVEGESDQYFGNEIIKIGNGTYEFGENSVARNSDGQGNPFEFHLLEATEEGSYQFEVEINLDVPPSRGNPPSLAGQTVRMYIYDSSTGISYGYIEGVVGQNNRALLTGTINLGVGVHQLQLVHFMDYYEPPDDRNLAIDQVIVTHLSQNENDAPVVSNPIDDVTATEDDPTILIDLSDVFEDPNGDDLSLSVTNDNGELLDYTLDGTMLRIVLSSDQNGTANITVTAEDPSGERVSDTFAVDVLAVNDAPIVTSGISDVDVEQDSNNTVIDLSSIFGDVDIVTNADELTFSVSVNGNPTLVNAYIQGNNLILDYVADQFGETDITIRATDLAGEFVEDEFHLVVNEVQEGLILITQTWYDAHVSENGVLYLDQADTEYVLEMDIDSERTAIAVIAQNVTIDFNGHRVTYDNHAFVDFDGSFELGSDAGNWDLSGAPSAEIRNDGSFINKEVWDGEWSLRFNVAENSTDIQTVRLNQTIDVPANMNVAFSAMFGDVKDITRWATLKNVATGEEFTISQDGRTWRGMQYTVLEDIPGGTYEVSISVQGNGSNAATDVWIDDLRLRSHDYHGILVGPQSWMNIPDIDRFGLGHGLSVKDSKGGGELVGGAGVGNLSHSIDLRRGEYSDIADITIITNGASSQSLRGTGKGVKAHDLTVISHVEVIKSRDNFNGAQVLLNSGDYTVDGGPEIYNNRFLDSLHMGVAISNARAHVHNNYFEGEAIYTNDFMLLVRRDMGSLLENNEINCYGTGHDGDKLGCRGMGGGSHTLEKETTIIRNNIVRAQGLGTNPEYNGSDVFGNYTLQLEGAKKFDVYENEFYAYGTITDYGQNRDAYAIRLNGDLAEISIHNNYIEAHTVEGAHAAALKVHGLEEGDVDFRDNTIKTNDGIVGLSAESIMSLFNTHIIVENQISDPFTFETSWSSVQDLHTEITFVDNTYGDAVSKQAFEDGFFRTEHRFNSGQGLATDRAAFSAKHTLNGQILDQNGEQLTDSADVTITDAEGTVVYSATVLDGDFSMLLSHFRKQGDDLELRTPHTILIESVGHGEIFAELTMDQIRDEIFQFEDSPPSDTIMMTQSWINSQRDPVTEIVYLDQEGATYELATDVVSKGTSFVVIADRVTVDTKGYNVTYGNKDYPQPVNASFENGEQGWDFSSAPSATTEGERGINEYFDGEKSVKFSIPANTDFDEKIVSTGTLRLEPGTYSINAMFSDIKNVDRYVEVRDLNDNLLGAAALYKKSNRGIQWDDGVFTVTEAVDVKIHVGVKTRDQLTADASVSIDDIFLSGTKSHAFLVGAQSDYHPDVMRSGGAEWFSVTDSVGTTHIQQGLGVDAWGHAINLNNQAKNATITNLKMTVNGANTQHIAGTWAAGTHIRDTDLYSHVVRIWKRDQFSAMIEINGQSSEDRQTEVTGNRLQGGLHMGISLTGGKAKVLNNYVELSSKYTNDFAIMLWSDKGSEVAHNEINCSGTGYMGAQLRCRGMHIGAKTDGKELTHVHNNLVTVESRPSENREYGGKCNENGTTHAYGIQNEGRGLNVLIEGNTINAVANVCAAHGYRQNTNPESTVFRNNTINAISNSDSTFANTISLGAGNQINYMHDLVITGNTLSVSGNSKFVHAHKTKDVDLIGNTFIVDPAHPHPDRLFQVYTWGTGDGRTQKSIQNLRLVDSLFLDAFSENSVKSTFVYTTRNARDSSSNWHFAHSVNAEIQDSNGRPVEGATVTIKDKDDNVVFSVVTDATGAIATILDEFYNDGTQIIDYRDYVVEVSHPVHGVILVNLTMNSSIDEIWQY